MPFLAKSDRSASDMEDILLNMDRSVGGASGGSTPYQSPSSSSNLCAELLYVKNMRFPVSIQENAYFSDAIT